MAKFKCPECKEGNIIDLETLAKTNSFYVNSNGEHYSKPFYSGALHYDWTQYQCTNESCCSHNTDNMILDNYVHVLQRGSIKC